MPPRAAPAQEKAPQPMAQGRGQAQPQVREAIAKALRASARGRSCQRPSVRWQTRRRRCAVSGLENSTPALLSCCLRNLLVYQLRVGAHYLLVPARGKLGEPASCCRQRYEARGRIYSMTRINAPATMLTYNGFRDLAQWHRFVAFVHEHASSWQVKHWCATLEANAKGKLHVHLMLQFHKKVDRSSRGFAFEGIFPRADPHDLLGEGWSRKKMQQSIDRAMFYCWANKIGTQHDEAGQPCIAGNYQPCWTQGQFKYAVLGRWPENLWKARKLTHETYERYLFACRDGVLARKRNLDACRAEESEKQEGEEMAVVVHRIRSNPKIFKPFPEVPVARTWLAKFCFDALRYPILVVLGPSSSGKTEWAKSLFKNALELKVGGLEHFPDGMRAFTRGVHDALILDDVRDLKFVVEHQDKLQGKYDAHIEFASTPGGQCSYKKWLFKVPTVITINFSTRNLDFLEVNDWLGKEVNRVVVTFGVSGASAGV